MMIPYQRRGKQKRQDGSNDVEAVNITQKSLQREPSIAPKRQRGKKAISLWTAFAFISMFVASICFGYNLRNNNPNNINKGREGQSPETLQI